ncbi:VTT domain-containing protein [Legionella taurinensis]|uniref:VTT domain-containing protein n=1 Tax=Legionella taurinensis TaxID=70611 RepID=UPI003617C42B
MTLFAEYIQPVTAWLHAHPHWALIFTFLISFTESLAIIGSVIPGSVTMTAIGILAGSGVMRIDLTLLAAMLGAVAGDSASYMLGYTFSDKLGTIWPFSRYPQWLTYGKDFFTRHGGKSVLIGRFVGPLRSIIPVIAGMMHMSHLRFYIANVISAIAWSILYVLPGILIGAASNELAPKSATKLFVFVLIVLGVIWLASVLVKWLIIRLNRFLKTHLHDFWAWSACHPHLARFFQFITPAEETNHYATAGLVLLFLVCFLSFWLVTILALHHGWVTGVNQPVHLLLQSIRTASFDSFFIVSAQLCSPLTLITLTASIVFITAYYRDWRTLAFFVSLLLSTTVLLLLTHWLIPTQRPSGLLEVKPGHSYPAIQLTYATAIFSALLYYIGQYGNSRIKPTINLIFNLALLVAGFANLYLGDHWFTDILGAYLAGLSLSVLHWLFYRRSPASVAYSSHLASSLALLLLVGSALSGLMNYNQELRGHQPYFAQYVFTDQLWWNQSKPLLPIYRVNRLGHPVSYFNLQYAGTVSRIESSLSAFGWRKQNESLYRSLLKRLNGHSSYAEMPLMAQLYQNRKPVLIMTYDPKDGGPSLVLRLWRSNYHLKHYRQPIWIGSVHSKALSKKLMATETKTPHHPALYYVRMALSQYLQREIALPVNPSKKLLIDVDPTLLLIKELAPSELFNFTVIPYYEHPLSPAVTDDFLRFQARY